MSYTVVDAFMSEVTDREQLSNMGLRYSSGDEVADKAERKLALGNPALLYEKAEAWAVKQWLLHIADPRVKVRQSDRLPFIQAKTAVYLSR